MMKRDIDDSNRFEEIKEDQEPPKSSKSSSIENISEISGSLDDPLQSKLSRATLLKELANSNFTKRDWNEALNEYSEALLILPPISPPKNFNDDDEEEENEFLEDGDEFSSARTKETIKNDKGKSKLEEESKKSGGVNQDPRVIKLRSVLNSNSAACYLNLEDWKSAVEACNLSLKDDPTYVKSLHRRAQANEKIGTWASLQASLDDYSTLSRLPGVPSPLMNEIKLKQIRLPKLINERSEFEKAEMMSKLKDLGNNVLGKFGLSTDNFKFTPNETGGYSMSFHK